MKSRSDTQQLKNFWTPDAIASAIRALAPMDPVAAFRNRPPPTEFFSPFGLADGLHDFRHIPPGVITEFSTCRNADFTGVAADIHGQFHQRKMFDRKLDRAKLTTNLGAISRDVHF